MKTQTILIVGHCEVGSICKTILKNKGIDVVIVDEATEIEPVKNNQTFSLTNQDLFTPEIELKTIDESFYNPMKKGGKKNKKNWIHRK